MVGIVLYQLTAPHYCAGVTVESGYVTHAAPILGWTRGRDWAGVQRWAMRKGYQVEPIEVRLSINP